MSRHGFTEQDANDAMNAANVEADVAPSSREEMANTFNFIRLLLTTGRGQLEQNLQSDINDLVVLAQRIMYPEDIDADFLGIYTVNLMRLLDTPNPNLNELNVILQGLSEVFNQVLTDEELASPITIGMALIDIVSNDTSIYDNLFLQKQYSEMTSSYVGELGISFNFYHEIIITG